MLKLQTNRRVQTALIMFLLFLATWVPRVASLDRSVTVDERKWLARSANFYHAMWHGDFVATLQSGHPGVPVMWAGALGFVQLEPTYARLATTSIGDGEDVETWIRQNSTHTPLELLVAGRWWMVLAIALIITIGYLPLAQLFGSSAAALITLFVSWDPFLLALSRQLHPDSLVANFTYLACLYFLTWLYSSQSRRALIISGVLMGVAWLTKVPAILLLPAGALIVLGELSWVKSGTRFSVRQAFTNIWPAQKRLIIDAILWGVIAVISFVVLWPAMWHGPLFTLENMAVEMRDYVGGHISVNYFWGRIVEDPGVFFYPVAYLFRTTPATLLGLLATIFCLWRRRWPFDRSLVRRSAAALSLFAIVFMVGMTLGGKKFDRYLLPIFPLLDVVAALGWIGVAHLAIEWGRKRSAEGMKAGMLPQQLERQGLPIVLGATFLLHGLFGFINYPEYLTYYNPLTGGSVTAPQVMMVGWGEGLDEAADWLNQQPDAENLRIASTYGDGPLSYFLKSKQPVQSFWTPDFWFDSDYAVLYVNQWQRSDIIRDIVNYFSEQTPAHVVRLHGLELARIYDMRIKPPPPFSGVYIDSAVNFANKIRLAAYSLGTHTFLTGDHLLIRLYLKSLAAIDKNYIVSVRLVRPDGTIVAHHEGAPGGEPAIGWPLQAVRYDYHELMIPSDAPSGDYQLVVAIYDPATPNIQLPVGSSAATRGDHSHTITTIQIRSATSYTINAQWNDVQITELQHEPRIKPEQPFFVDATATGKVDGSLKLSLRLIDQAEQTVAQADTVLSASMRVELTLPADAASGTYKIAAVVYDPQTLAPLPDQAGQFTTNLSKVEYVK